MGDRRTEGPGQAQATAPSRRVLARWLGGGGLAAGLALLGGRTAVAARRQGYGDEDEADKEALARRFFEAVNRDDLDALDDLATDDIVGHVSPVVPFPGRGEGLAGVKEKIAALRAAFPDAEVTLEDLVVQGDLTAARLTLRGTHEGEALGLAPTGAAVEVTALGLVRFAGDRAAEYWLELDLLDVAVQLGLLEPPATPEA